MAQRIGEARRKFSRYAVSMSENETGLVTGLQVIAIYVTDLERALEFYRGLLGFEEIGKMPPGLVLACGGVTIYVEPGHTRRPDDPAAGCGIAPAFAAESVLATHKLLAAAGVPILGEIQHPNEEFAMFQCLDPDGNIVEFAGAP